MTPIIIVHKGNSFYLPYVIRQARIYNPDNRIVLISDKSTRNVVRGLCEHVDLERFQDSATRFEKIYKHRSSNGFGFELFCFKRWLIVGDFIKSQGLERFVCIDSDFLLYDNVDTFLRPFADYDLTICGEMVPNCVMFSSESIARFCDFLFEMYTDKALDAELLEEYENYRKKNQIGGICDMTAFVFYSKKYPQKVVDITIPHNGVAVDDCFYNQTGFEGDESNQQFIMQRVPKKILWKDNLPYAIWSETQEQVRMAGIHLQGGAKRILYKFLVDESKVRRSGFIYRMSWFFKPAMMKYRFDRVLNKILLIMKKDRV